MQSFGNACMTLKSAKKWDHLETSKTNQETIPQIILTVAWDGWGGVGWCGAVCGGVGVCVPDEPRETIDTENVANRMQKSQDSKTLNTKSSIFHMLEKVAYLWVWGWIYCCRNTIHKVSSDMSESD